MQTGKNSITTTAPATGETGASEKGASVKTIPAKTPDFRFANHFSICFLHPLTDAARAWVDEHIGQDNSYQPQWPSVLLEPRYCPEILAALFESGFSVVSQ
jgi:hypothetical protein